MKKRALTLALALALCLGLMVPSFAAELKIVEIPAPVVEEYKDADYATDKFSEGVAVLYVYGANGTKSGVVDKTGKLVVPAGKYDGIWEFSEGLAVVQKAGKFGVIDKTGKEVVPCQYSQDPSTGFRPLSEFSEGLTSLVKDGKFGYIDKTGKEVVPCRYDLAYDFSEGLAAVQKDGKRGFIDKTGREVVPCQYEDVSSFSEGLAAVCAAEKGWSFIDKTGKEVLSCQYDRVGPFSEGLAAVYAGGKGWGFIDKTGKEVITCQYGGAGPFSDGLAAVRQEETDGKWGYIDMAGKLVIPCKYSGEATPFSGGFAVVSDRYHDGQAADPQDRPACGIIDKTGREVIQPGVHTKDGAEYILLGIGRSYGFDDGVSRLMWSCVSGSADGSVAYGDSSLVYYTITVDAKISSWAQEQVGSAAVKGLVPDSLGDDLTVNITRAQFAAVAVELYEAMSGSAAPAPGEDPFSDTDDPVVLQANALGIVTGSDGKFSPNDPVTRQEAALMLSRVYTKLGGKIPEVEAAAFADNGEIAPWAMDAVAFMSDRGVVSGVGGDRFDPRGSASIEQALIIALRMIEKLDVE